MTSCAGISGQLHGDVLWGNKQHDPCTVKDEPIPIWEMQKRQSGQVQHRTHHSKSNHLLLPLKLGASALQAALPDL